MLEVSRPPAPPCPPRKFISGWNISIGAAVALGLLLRILAGWSQPGLWYDEILWFDRFLDGFTRGIRAPGYTFFHYHYFLSLNGLQEYKIRIVSIVSGLAVVPLFALLTHKLFANVKLTVIGTLLVSVNIAAVSFTHEFKPYSMELFLHTAWLLCIVGFTNKRVATLTSTLILLAGLTLSYGLIPLIAFQIVYVGYLWWKKRIKLVDVILCYALCGAYLFYFLGLYGKMKGASTKQWGKKYGVFFDPRLHGAGLWAYLSWFFAKVSTYVSYPFNLFRELPFSDRAAGFRKGYGYIEAGWLGVLFLGATVAKVIRTRFDDERLIPVYLLAGYTLAGLLRIYPLGFFRANLFILVYATLSVLFLLEGMLKKLTPQAGSIALCILLLPTLFFTAIGPIGSKFFYNLNWSDALARVCKDAEQGPIAVITDAKTGFAFNFYRKTAASPECSTRISRNVFTSPETLERLLQRNPRAYIFFAGSPKLLPERIDPLIVEHFQGTQVSDAGGMYEYVIKKQ